MQCTTNTCPNDRVDSPNFQCGTICTTKGTKLAYLAHIHLILAVLTLKSIMILKFFLFYLGDKSGSFVELKKSTFTGYLASGSFHINGKLVHKDAPKLVVKDCNFDSNSTSSINLGKNNKFISFNLKKQ